MSRSQLTHEIEYLTKFNQREIAKGMVSLINCDLTYKEEYCTDTGLRILLK